MLTIDRENGIALLRLQHGKANLMDLELCQALESALQELADDDSRAVVLTATGSIFSAGVDLKRLVEGGAKYSDRFVRALSEVLEALFAFEKPLVAAINGHAIAGGMVMAAAADWRAMAQGPFRLGVPELAVGVPFPPAAIELIRFALPPTHWTEFILECGLVDADAGVDRGFLQAALPPDDLLPAALLKAERLAAPSPDRFAFTKRQLRGPALAHLRAERLRLDAEIAHLWRSPDTMRAVSAYVEATLAKR
ncbi:MAG: enoyl-CoA hydratase-related protein [Candidatus Eisenbacteria bacterium]